MIATGVVGSSWRALVEPSGAVVPADGSAALRWLIAADDRWHDPEQEATVRQARRRGTPVVDTRVRVPGGDIEQTVWTVADHGGLTLVELRNESPLPVAVALTRRDVLTARAPSSVVAAGIDAPPDALVLPLGHRASITVAVAHDGRGAGPLPSGFATAETVADAWAARTDSASRLDLPADGLADRVRAVRSELMLAGVDGALERQPARALVAFGELLRVGELTPDLLDDVIPDVAALAESVLRAGGAGTGPALRAVRRLLAAAGEERAVADLRRGIARRAAAGGRAAAATPGAVGKTVPAGGAVVGGVAAFDRIADGDPLLVAAVEDAICDDGVVFPSGVPAGWAGQNIEAHGLQIGERERLSLAVRWHGRNPALLWEIEPGASTPAPDVAAGLRSPLTTPEWSTTEPRGEALLVLPD